MANHAKKNKRPAAKKGTFGRLFRYLFDHYGMRLIVVMLCIIVSAVASVIATVFLQRLIDECIVPGISSGMGAVHKSACPYSAHDGCILCARRACGIYI